MIGLPTIPSIAMGRMERPIFLLRRQRRGIVDSQVPSAFQAVEPQRYLVGMLPRGGDTAEICIICVPIRHGYTFTVYDFVGWRAFVQREPQPQRQDLPVGVEGRDNVYPFRHVCITSILLYKRMFEKSTVKISDLTQEILETPKKDQENLFSQMQNIEGAHFSLDTPQLSLTARVSQQQNFI